MTKQLKDKMGLWLFRYIWPYFREGKKNYMWDFQTVDDKGKELNTIELSEFIEKRMIAGDKKVVFIIGGAYGIHKKLYERANFKWSLSKLTFPHQLARLILAESLYRAISVIKKEPYHHE